MSDNDFVDELQRQLIEARAERDKLSLQVSVLQKKIAYELKKQDGDSL
jgi:hypothetical protein